MMRGQRGFSIAEVLTVTVILGVLMSALVFIIPVMLKAPQNVQTQVDDINMAAVALYEVRRDFGQSDTSGVMGCSTTPAVSCSSLGPGLTSVQAFAVVTADNGSGSFQVDTAGYPKWMGFYVYWLAPNQTGTAMQLMRAFEPAAITSINGVPNNITQGMANTAVGNALIISPPPVLTNYIQSMQLGDNPANSTISFELFAGTVAGQNQTQTTFQSDTYARN